MNHCQRTIIAVSGFTLIELIIALLVGAIVTALSAPMANMLKSNQAGSIAYEFVSALNFARSEAIKRGNHVTVCRTINGARCEGQPDINEQKVWDSGWMVFSDFDGDGEFNPEQDEILSVHGPLPDGYTLHSSAKVRVTYKPIGISPGFMDSWTVCAPGAGPGFAKGIIVAYSGRVRFAEDTNGNGTIDNGTLSMQGEPRELECNV
ncbi:MAG: GspH/FimT family pseudopilin [Gammaproteobacteria bacterium]|nr:GspH/FimT family pseudopilin [Gammaproteobacteria bacterium]